MSVSSDIRVFDVVEAMNGVKNTCEGCQGHPINVPHMQWIWCPCDWNTYQVNMLRTLLQFSFSFVGRLHILVECAQFISDFTQYRYNGRKLSHFEFAISPRAPRLSTHQ